VFGRAVGNERCVVEDFEGDMARKRLAVALEDFT